MQLPQLQYLPAILGGMRLLYNTLRHQYVLVWLYRGCLICKSAWRYPRDVLHLSGSKLGEGAVVLGSSHVAISKILFLLLLASAPRLRSRLESLAKPSVSLSRLLLLFVLHTLVMLVEVPSGLNAFKLFAPKVVDLLLDHSCDQVVVRQVVSQSGA